MQIDWFTVIAQVLNFLILVWLLKRFLYKPILKAIDEREEKIASQIRDAEAKDTLAKKEHAEFIKKNETFDKQKKGLMDKAVAETNAEREKLFETARNEAANLRSKLEKALDEMQENLNHDIVQKTQQEVFEIARKALADLASVSLEEQSVIVFIKRINDLKKEEKQHFIDSFKSESSPVMVQSAFDLSKKQQTEITNAVNKLIGTETHFQFKTSPEIISGVELSANGYKLAWSISEYLNSLQKSISQTRGKESNEIPSLESKTKAKPKVKEESKTKTKPKTELKAKSNKV